MAFSMSDITADCQYRLCCSNTNSLAVRTCINYGTTRAVLGWVQLHFAQHLQFTQEQVVNTTKQSTTVTMSLMENAIYTTTMEVTHSC